MILEDSPRDWSVYILRCDGRSLYTGITTDISRRLAEHASGSPRGARCTRAFSQLELVFSVNMRSRGLASRVEARIKRMSHSQKETLVDSHPSENQLLRLLGMAEFLES